MRISGTEPSASIFSQTKKFKKLKSDAQKSAETSQSQKRLRNKPTKLQFQSIKKNTT